MAPSASRLASTAVDPPLDGDTVRVILPTFLLVQTLHVFYPLIGATTSKVHSIDRLK